ncbi:MAG TPA: hypothetical protein V6D03_12790 [Candidatus Caenarcaniphilales bacterium]
MTTHSTSRRLTTSEIRHASRAEVSQIHQDNIRQTLEHRLQVARAQGDESLIRLLEAEQRQQAS